MSVPADLSIWRVVFLAARFGSAAECGTIHDHRAGLEPVDRAGILRHRPLHLAPKLPGDRGRRSRKQLASLRSLRRGILQRRHRLPLLSVRAKPLPVWLAELFPARPVEQKKAVPSRVIGVFDGAAGCAGCAASRWVDIKPYQFFVLVALLLPALFDFSARHKWDRWLGELSYPLYLVHWPVLVFGVAISQLPHMAALGRSQAYPYALIAVSLIASHAINRWIVNPIDSWRQARIRKSATGLAEVAISTTAQPATG